MNEALQLGADVAARELTSPGSLPDVAQFDGFVEPLQVVRTEGSVGQAYGAGHVDGYDHFVGAATPTIRAAKFTTGPNTSPSRNIPDPDPIFVIRRDIT